MKTDFDIYVDRIESKLVEEESFHDRMIDEQDTRGGYFYEWGLSAEAISHAHSLLGDVRGKHILDYGCGTGDETIRLARLGAMVAAIDIANNMVLVTKARATSAGVNDRVIAAKMYGEDLHFADGTFDIIFGISVIHHVAIDMAGPEIYRVLKPGGKAIFVEPLDYNPIINIFRRLTPKRRSQTEKPLTYTQIQQLATGYQQLNTYEFNLFNVVAVMFPWYPVFRRVMAAGTWLDRTLLRVFPALRKYCWITVIEMVK